MIGRGRAQLFWVKTPSSCDVTRRQGLDCLQQHRAVPERGWRILGTSQMNGVKGVVEDVRG